MQEPNVKATQFRGFVNHVRWAHVVLALYDIYYKSLNLQIAYSGGSGTSAKTEHIKYASILTDLIRNFLVSRCVYVCRQLHFRAGRHRTDGQITVL